MPARPRLEAHPPDQARVSMSAAAAVRCALCAVRCALCVVGIGPSLGHSSKCVFPTTTATTILTLILILILMIVIIMIIIIMLVPYLAPASLRSH